MFGLQIKLQIRMDMPINSGFEKCKVNKKINISFNNISKLINLYVIFFGFSFRAMSSLHGTFHQMETKAQAKKFS